MEEFGMKRIIIGFFGLFLFYSCVSLKQENTSISLHDAIQKSVRDIENTLDSDTKVAVVNFTSVSETFSEYIVEELTNSLVNGKKLIVLERKALDLIRDEFVLQYSGQISDESMQSIGKMLGAQTIIFGSITKINMVYRFRVNALDVETAIRIASSSEDVRNDSQIESLLNNTLPSNEQSVYQEYINENIKIKILQDNKEIIPILVTREFGGEMPSYIIANKEFDITLPDIGNTLVSASTRGFFWNPLTDETMLDFGYKEGYPYFIEAVSCFASKKGFDGHNTAYNNQLYVGYAYDGNQWYESGERIQIQILNVYDKTAKEYAVAGGQDNIYVVFWINKNKDSYVNEDEILIIELQIRSKGTLLK
jgi:TolB-like protein